MFPAMRRSDKALPEREVFDMLQHCTSGVLALCGKDGYPYAVPVSHVCDPESKKLYFHCFREGYKLDLIRQNDRVSFCVVERDDVVPEEFATHFRSTVLFGRARIVTDDALRRHALRLLNAKFSPQYPEQGKRKSSSRGSACAWWRSRPSTSPERACPNEPPAACEQTLWQGKK